MKNLASVLLVLFAFTLTTNAQRKNRKERPQFTVEQQTELAVKKMTLHLDLSAKQQNQLKPIIASKMADRNAFIEKRKEARKEKKRPTSDEIYAMQSKKLDNEIAMKNTMKDILNKEQFEKFEKMQKKRKMKGKKMMENKRKGKKGERGERRDRNRDEE